MTRSADVAEKIYTYHHEGILARARRQDQEADWMDFQHSDGMCTASIPTASAWPDTKESCRRNWSGAFHESSHL